ncbi:hypothetical protein BH09PSE5_BH09PSE5_46190 [soil metagenome]
MSNVAVRRQRLLERSCHATFPFLHIDDYEKAKAYQAGWLGFEIDWEFRHEPSLPVYMQVSRDGMCLHVSEHRGGNAGPATSHIEVDDLDGWVFEMKPRDPSFRAVPVVMEWNAMHLSLWTRSGTCWGSMGRYATRIRLAIDRRRNGRERLTANLQ